MLRRKELREFFTSDNRQTEKKVLCLGLEDLFCNAERLSRKKEREKFFYLLWRRSWKLELKWYETRSILITAVYLNIPYDWHTFFSGVFLSKHSPERVSPLFRARRLWKSHSSARLIRFTNRGSTTRSACQGSNEGNIDEAVDTARRFNCRIWFNGGEKYLSTRALPLSPSVYIWFCRNCRSADFDLRHGEFYGYRGAPATSAPLSTNKKKKNDCHASGKLLTFWSKVVSASVTTTVFGYQFDTFTDINYLWLRIYILSAELYIFYKYTCICTYILIYNSHCCFTNTIYVGKESKHL